MQRTSWKFFLLSMFAAAAVRAASPINETAPPGPPAAESPVPAVGPVTAPEPGNPIKPAAPAPAPAGETAPAPAPAPAAPPPEATHGPNPSREVRKSLVRITVTSQDANYKVPWVPGSNGGGVGAGFIVDGQRIVTNAHVISNARFITVEKDNDPKKYIARVEFVGHDCDLAVLKVDEPNFFKNTIALKFGGIPEIESTVTVYGYPIGGERMSVTNGIVSRIDFQTYTHSGVDAHLTIQTSAPINPGNSGGPVLQGGKVIGVAFQGYSGDVAQNTGYMIPTPVVIRFLKDIEDGKYDRYMDLSVSMFELQNPAMRRALGLGDDDLGVMVGLVSSAGSAEGILKTGDVLLSIDGLPIASDAFVELDGERVHMGEVVERKFKGDEVKIHLLRDKKETDVAVSLKAAWAYGIQANAYDVLPRYVLFGGLLFQPLSRDFLEANGVEDLRIRYMYDYFIADEIFKEHPEVIVISAVLPDQINNYYGGFRNSVVETVNGEKIKTLNDLAAAFDKKSDQYVIKVMGSGLPIVLESKDIDDARKRIMQGYNVSSERNLVETPEK